MVESIAVDLWLIQAVFLLLMVESSLLWEVIANTNHAPTLIQHLTIHTCKRGVKLLIASPRVPCMVVTYGSHIRFLKNHLYTPFILVFWKDSWAPRKVLILCVLRETGQMPILFYWFRCIIRFWNSSLSSNNPLLEKLCGLTFFLQTEVIHYQVLQSLQEIPAS
jgi:hypothetical protein